MREQRQPPDAPVIEPGQLWLIEQDAASALSPSDRCVLTAANVVLYDRALEAHVAAILPLGAYAEPLSAAPSAAAISPRAIQFAADGWSVVQLVEARGGRRARLQHAAAALAPRSTGALPVQVIADGDRRDACLPTLAAVAGEFAAAAPLTLVFGPLALRAPASLPAFTANGLAG
jgi:hypothetical protein